jgi:hypothetical protein
VFTLYTHKALKYDAFCAYNVNYHVIEAACQHVYFNKSEKGRRKLSALSQNIIVTVDKKTLLDNEWPKPYSPPSDTKVILFENPGYFYPLAP